MKTYILLENIVFYAHHGFFDHEQLVGNEFILNIKIEVDLSESCVSDQLTDTISYAKVYEMTKNEIDKPSHLLENVAYRIVRSLKSTYPTIETVEVKISKRNPPMGAQLDAASILIID